MTTFVFGPAAGAGGPFAQVAAVAETEARRRVQSVITQRDWTNKGAVLAWVTSNANWDFMRGRIADRVEALI